MAIFGSFGDFNGWVEKNGWEWRKMFLAFDIDEKWHANTRRRVQVFCLMFVYSCVKDAKHKNTRMRLRTVKQQSRGQDASQDSSREFARQWHKNYNFYFLAKKGLSFQINFNGSGTLDFWHLTKLQKN